MEDVDLLQVQRSIPHRTEDLQLIPRPQLFYDIAEVLGGLEGCALYPAPSIQLHFLIVKGQEYVSTSDHPGRPGDETVQPVAELVALRGAEIERGKGELDDPVGLRHAHRIDGGDRNHRFTP